MLENKTKNRCLRIEVFGQRNVKKNMYVSTLQYYVRKERDLVWTSTFLFE